MNDPDPSIISLESAVRDRYTQAALQKEKQLCCAVNYNAEYLRVIPEEVLEKDYGCGDPSPYLKPGETVLDLGSGTGEMCFIAAQVVGPKGRVLGVDMTDEMLAIARRNTAVVAKRIGYDNVEFRKGRIQDLSLDLALLEAELHRHPIDNLECWLGLEARIESLRRERPLIKGETIDVVISNCVLNLVSHREKQQLFREIFRVLKTEGRAVIADIVSSKEVPQSLQQDPHLWNGCISGALTASDFINAFRDVGFMDVAALKSDTKPWRTLDGVDFYSMTVEASKKRGNNSTRVAPSCCV